MKNKINSGEAAKFLLQQALDRWGETVDDTDADINGGDAVEWLVDFIQEAQAILRNPGYTGLLKA